jgi:hypothetical protein
MKKITIVTAIAAILAVAPLMVGCGGETADEVTEPGDDAEGEESTEDADIEPTDSKEESEDGE